jgi:heterodisulfide reductase subunit C
MAIAENIQPAQKDIEIFHRVFLDQVKSQGRVHEVMLAAKYNLKSGHLFSNMERLPAMISKGKLEFMPSRIKGAGKVKDIFAKVKAIEEKL